MKTNNDLRTLAKSTYNRTKKKSVTSTVNDHKTALNSANLQTLDVVPSTTTISSQIENTSSKSDLNENSLLHNHLNGTDIEIVPTSIFTEPQDYSEAISTLDSFFSDEVLAISKATSEININVVENSNVDTTLIQGELDIFNEETAAENEVSSLADLLFMQQEEVFDSENSMSLLDEKQLAKHDEERALFEEILKKQFEEQKRKDDTLVNEQLQRKLNRHTNFIDLLKVLYDQEEDTNQEYSGPLVSIVRRLNQEEHIGLTDFLVINRVMVKHDIKYDLKEIQSFLVEPILSVEIPPINFFHLFYFFSDLDKKIPPFLWDRLKIDIFNKAGYKCELCHGVGKTNPVELYPLWVLYEQTRVQMLKGYMALCPKCVDGKNHYLLKNNRMIARYEAAREHVKNLNEWSDDDLEENFKLAYDCYKKRCDSEPNENSFKPWAINISLLESIFNIKLNDVSKFHQQSHLPRLEVKHFEDHAKYLFQKVEAYRMHLTGKTRFLSIHIDSD